MFLDQRAGLHEACRQISPINPDYVTLPIEEGFDWSCRLGGTRFEGLYLVVFRSVRRASADLQLLKEHDDRAYETALRAGGLLRYFKGEADERRECLSFCLWESSEQAVAASGGASHRAAARLTGEMYESYDLERYVLTQVHTAEGTRILFESIVPPPSVPSLVSGLTVREKEPGLQ